MTLRCVLLVCALAAGIAAMPYEDLPMMVVRSGRAPHRAMMFSGFYGSPLDGRQGEESMTSFTAGAAGCKHCDEPREEKEAKSASDEGSWPLRGNGQPSYSSFFPMMFSYGGYGAGRRSADGADGGGFEGGFPGANTAIANSFSTGRSGQATSYAVSMGTDPAILRRLFRSQPGDDRQ